MPETRIAGPGSGSAPVSSAEASAPRRIGAAAVPDHLRDAMTVLSTKGPAATKIIGPGPDGRLAILEGYSLAARFSVASWPVGGVDDLYFTLLRLERKPQALAVRADGLPGINPGDCRRRLHAHRGPDGTLIPPCCVPVPRRWAALDFDSIDPPPGLDWPSDIPAAVAYLATLLPPQFAGVSAVAQITASAGIKPGVRLRLWYWFDRRVSDAELARWLQGAPVDTVSWRAVQPIYTARPLFRGCRDPLSQRLFLVRGQRDAVPVPDLPESASPHPVSSARRSLARGRSPAYAKAALHRECDAVARTAPSGSGTAGRHEALNSAAFKLGRFVRSGELAAADVVAGLLWAARAAGLDDDDNELRRFLRYGLRAGLERAGVRP